MANSQARMRQPTRILVLGSGDKKWTRTRCLECSVYQMTNQPIEDDISSFHCFLGLFCFEYLSVWGTTTRRSVAQKVCASDSTNLRKQVRQPKARSSENLFLRKYVPHKFEHSSCVNPRFRTRAIVMFEKWISPNINPVFFL